MKGKQLNELVVSGLLSGIFTQKVIMRVTTYFFACGFVDFLLLTESYILRETPRGLITNMAQPNIYK